MARRQKHRQPVIDASVTLFRRRGYAATGLNDIVEASGAPKGSLYHYFPGGKASIAVAAVEEAGRRVCETLRELAGGKGSAGTLIRAHAELLARWMASSGFKDGCPITTVLLELAPANRAVAEAGRKAYADRLAILRDRLVADGHSEDRAQRLASLCTSALQGALIESRVQRSGKPLEIAAQELATMLDGIDIRGI
ncbi:MAG: TetR/AcrR family transcriptional regulator [Gammaproteobacteria bacterium]|nr:MAG: TetR/AcrR family transcriptional regulator [Gammaproteobacteria bacterium]